MYAESALTDSEDCDGVVAPLKSSRHGMGCLKSTCKCTSYFSTFILVTVQ